MAATIVPGATGYRFEVTNLTTNAVQTVDRSLFWFRLTDLASYDYGTVYSVRVMLSIGGTYLGYYGPACTVTSPGPIPASGVGPASVRPLSCNSFLAFNYTTIFATTLSGATGYRFEVTGAGSTQVIDRPILHFNLSQLANNVYNTPYTIRVAVRTTGDFGPYGPSCVVNSPAIPNLTQCGATVAAGTTLTGTAQTGVTEYQFEVTGPSGVQLISRNVPFFPTTMITGYSSASTYTIRIRVRSTGILSPFNDGCVINPIAGPRFTNNSSNLEFNAVAYPNPFATNFKLEVTTSSSTAITVVVYDMVGKMLVNQEVNASDINTLELGNNYPAGIYNVVVSQGNDVKSIRMIKN